MWILPCTRWTLNAQEVVILLFVIASVIRQALHLSAVHEGLASTSRATKINPALARALQLMAIAT